MRSALASSGLLSNVLLHAPAPSALAFQLAARSPRSIGCAREVVAGGRYYRGHSSARYSRRALHYRKSALMMSSASSSTPSSPASTTVADIVGGDYAGLSATFSSSSGALVPVPDHLVPQSMLDWGDIPSYFEVLTSEDWTPSKCGDGLERTSITVLPEVGCGIDNLEVVKRKEEYGSDVSRFVGWSCKHPESGVVAVDRIGKSRTVDVETVFQVDSESNEEGEGGEASSRRRRIRVSLSVEVPEEPTSEPTVSKLVTLQVERLVSSQSTQGTAWSGPSSNSGGLDARTVMNTIGKGIVYGDVFSVKKTKAGGDVWDSIEESEKSADGGALGALEGTWRRIDVSVEDGEGGATEVQRTLKDFGEGAEKDSAFVTLRLPQNILVKYGSAGGAPWTIEVSHVSTAERDGKAHLRRRVVSRSIDSANFGDGGGSSLGDDGCWLEEK